MIELYNRLVLTQSQNEPISVFSLDEVREVRDYNPDLIRRSIAFLSMKSGKSETIIRISSGDRLPEVRAQRSGRTFPRFIRFGAS